MYRNHFSSWDIASIANSDDTQGRFLSSCRRRVPKHRMGGIQAKDERAE
jgi:hypothetical protein